MDDSDPRPPPPAPLLAPPPPPPPPPPPHPHTYPSFSYTAEVTTKPVTLPFSQTPARVILPLRTVCLLDCIQFLCFKYVEYVPVIPLPPPPPPDIPLPFLFAPDSERLVTFCPPFLCRSFSTLLPYKSFVHVTHYCDDIFFVRNLELVASFFFFLEFATFPPFCPPLYPSFCLT